MPKFQVDYTQTYDQRADACMANPQAFLQAYFKCFGKPKAMKIQENGWPLTSAFRKMLGKKGFGEIAELTISTITLQQKNEHTVAIQLLDDFETALENLPDDDEGTEVDPVTPDTPMLEKQALLAQFNNHVRKGMLRPQQGLSVTAETMDNRRHQEIKKRVEEANKTMALMARSRKKNAVPEADRPSQAEVTESIKTAVDNTFLNGFPRPRPALGRNDRIHEDFPYGVPDGATAGMVKMTRVS